MRRAPMMQIDQQPSPQEPSRQEPSPQEPSPRAPSPGTDRPPAQTRTADTENFPVASLLIARDLRPAVRAFYAVARAADDIADDASLSEAEKLRLLNGIDAALADRADTGTEIGRPREDSIETAALAAAARAGRILADRDVPTVHIARLLQAFRRDAVRPRTADWAELMAYCADSANPVGRFLLDLHGESGAHHPASDALCTALQILNHLQDCGDDYRELDRVYLPADWLAEAGVAPGDLAASRSTPGLRRVIDRCLARVTDLLTLARPLPLRLRSARLALETAVVLALADALARRLAVSDPLAERVQVPKPAMLGHALIAVSRCLWQRCIPARDVAA
ncbi:MAG: squalene synthase HpnC [Thalassobaculaceae bacterium]